MNRAVPAVAFMLLAGACAAPRCQNAERQRVSAPGGAHDAVVYQRSCGAGEGSSTEVTVLPQGADLPDVPTSVLTLADSVTVVARWQSPAQLAVSYPATAHVVVMVNRSSEGVAVVYATDVPVSGRTP